jgi:hypothetical protein
VSRGDGRSEPERRERREQPLDRLVLVELVGSEDGRAVHLRPARAELGRPRRGRLAQPPPRAAQPAYS